MATPTYSKYSFYTPAVKAPAKPKAPPKPMWTQADIDASLAANPQAGLANLDPSISFVPPPGTFATGMTAPPSVHIPGVSPDYKALIASDPGVIAGEADLAFYTGQLTDAKRAAIRRAVIQAGLAPPGAFGDIDQATIDAAKQNQFSVAADLARSASRGNADVGQNLAARGILSSGGLVNGRQRVQEGFERGTTQLTQQLLDQIMGVETSTADKLFGYRTQYNQLREAAATRIANDPRYQPIADTDAVLDPGSGLYLTADGRWFDRNGNKVSGPGASAPTQAPSNVAPPPPLPVVTEFPNSRPFVNPIPGAPMRAV